MRTVIVVGLLAMSLLAGCREEKRQPTHRTFTQNGPATPVPEPSTLLLLGSGVSGLGIWKGLSVLRGRKHRKEEDA